MNVLNIKIDTKFAGVIIYIIYGMMAIAGKNLINKEGRFRGVQLGNKIM